MARTGMTARDIPGRAFVPHLALYLRDSGKLGLPTKFPTQEEIIQWWYKEAASMIHQFYLHPSFGLPKPVPVPNNKIATDAKKLLIQMRNACILQFKNLGWLIKDEKSGIILVSDSGKQVLDNLAKTVSLPAKYIP